MILSFILILFSSLFASEYNALLKEDIEEQKVFIFNNLKKIQELERDLETSVKRSIQRREACIRAKITSVRILELAMKAGISDETVSLSRVLRLRKLNNLFSKIYSEITLCRI